MCNIFILRRSTQQACPMKTLSCLECHKVEPWPSTTQSMAAESSVPWSPWSAGCPWLRQSHPVSWQHLRSIGTLRSFILMDFKTRQCQWFADSKPQRPWIQSLLITLYRITQACIPHLLSCPLPSSSNGKSKAFFKKTCLNWNLKVVYFIDRFNYVYVVFVLQIKAKIN